MIRHPRHAQSNDACVAARAVTARAAAARSRSAVRGGRGSAAPPPGRRSPRRSAAARRSARSAKRRSRTPGAAGPPTVTQPRLRWRAAPAGSATVRRLPVATASRRRDPTRNRASAGPSATSRARATAARRRAAWGANTPWYSSRLTRGFGVIAARRPRKSSGSNSSARVPSRHGRRSSRRTRPSGAIDERILRDGRPQDVAAEVLEARPVAGGNGDPRVQVEAGDVRVARRTGAVVRRGIRRAAEAHRSAAGLGADRRRVLPPTPRRGPRAAATPRRARHGDRRRRSRLLRRRCRGAARGARCAAAPSRARARRRDPMAPAAARSARRRRRTTPCTTSEWKWTFKFAAEPKRWIAVTAPPRPSATPRRRARRRSKDSTARMNTASTRRQSRWS